MRYTELIKNKFYEALREYSMFSCCDTVFAGFSGGADSTALLFLLKDYCKENGKKLFAIHVNHGIRGEEAERDANFCKDFCIKYHIEFIPYKADVPALSKSRGTGLEETARDLRYSIFEKHMSETENSVTATAHNADDNTETVIFNLARGSGAKGIRGIPPVRDGIVRPLIYCTKAEIKAFCEENGLTYVFDSTNNDTDLSRNFIRHKIIPLLKELNPSLDSAVRRLSESLRQDEEFISLGVKEYIDSDSVKLLSSLHPSLLSRLLMEKFAKYSDKSLSNKHIDAMMLLLKKNVKWSRISLPDGYCAVIEGCYGTDCDRFLIKKEAARGSVPYDLPLEKGKILIPGTALELWFAEEKDIDSIKNIYNSSTLISLASDKIKGELRVRSRKEGDTVKKCGMSKKVRKLLNEKKIPEYLRDSFPILYDDEGIIAIPSVAVRDGAEIKSDAENALYIIFGGEENYYE
ncbi:MAG: tRNA lysidine(34) synthetase TilS [Ruminococcaceae bacterium]|nr:tRNA lysidine(34) synthetase TilS [Oscillospiraceae bacterium]